MTGDRHAPTPGLQRGERTDVAPSSTATPYNVLFIVNESWDKDHLRLYDDGVDQPAMPRLHDWVRREQEAGRAFVFEHAFTNSSASDVSFPSIFTGVASFARASDFHRAPLAWQWAEAAGMHSLLVTCQHWGWANFDDFLLSPPPDRHATAETLDLPLVNSIGVDEIAGAERFASMLRSESEPDRPLFAVYASNALHLPYQQKSPRLETQPSAPTRYRRALELLDIGLGRIFEALEETGRLERTFVVVTSDHGRPSSNRDLPRLFSFYDSVVEIPFVIRVPEAYAADHPDAVDALRQNTRRNVANVDIIPTLADLLALDDVEDNHSIVASLRGHPLTRPVDPDRRIVAVNTNDLRRWGHEGFGIYWRNMRLVASTAEGIGLYDVSDDPRQQRNLLEGSDRGREAPVFDLISDHWHLKRIYTNIATMHPTDAEKLLE